MKLRQGLFKQTIDDTTYLVAVDRDAPGGLIKGNSTAGRIFDLLQEETTQEAITDALYVEYEAPRERIAADVARVIDTLRRIGAIEE